MRDPNKRLRGQEQIIRAAQEVCEDFPGGGHRHTNGLMACQIGCALCIAEMEALLVVRQSTEARLRAYKISFAP